MQNIIGQPKSQLDTPCLVIDKNLLKANIKAMQVAANNANKNLRPHVKTHKCIEICKLQIEAGAIGIAAAKVSEALILAKNGFKNTLITSPVITDAKLDILMRCLHHDPNLIVVVDNIDNAKRLHQRAVSAKNIINILIDIDPGVGRTGIPYHHIINFAQRLQDLRNLKLFGIQCYAGNLQHIPHYTTRHEASLTVMQKAAECMHQLNTNGFACEILSGSGTGTYAIDFKIPEVTEVQPGSYTVMDAEYQAIMCSDKTFNPSMTLLSSVISVNHDTHVTCDAGWKSLYEVPTKPIVLNPPGYEYEWFGDEHGKISSVNQTPLPTLGDRLELMVAHCDPTINMHDLFFVTEDDIVTEVWPIEMRGKSQ